VSIALLVNRAAALRVKSKQPPEGETSMHKLLPLAAAAVIAAVGLAACGGSHPDAAACKKAMKAEFAAALASGQQGEEPAACKGLSDAELRKLAGQVLTGQ
jgi:hypothetical protein